MSDYNSLTELAKLAPEEMKDFALRMSAKEETMSMEEKLDAQAEFGKHIDEMPVELRDKMAEMVVKLGMAEADKAVDLLSKVTDRLVEEGTQSIHPCVVAVGKAVVDGCVKDMARMFILDGESMNATRAMKMKNFVKVASILWRSKWMPFAIAFSSEAWTVKRDKGDEDLGGLSVSDMPDKQECIIAYGLTPTTPNKTIIAMAPVHRDAREYIKGPLVFEKTEIDSGGSIAHQIFATLGELVRNEKTIEQVEAEAEGVTVTEM